MLGAGPQSNAAGNGTGNGTQAGPLVKAPSHRHADTASAPGVATICPSRNNADMTVTPLLQTIAGELHPRSAFERKVELLVGKGQPADTAPWAFHGHAATTCAAG
jgi:hypothetical protein